jgi:hypothetical protein
MNSRYLVARFHEHIAWLAQQPGDHRIGPDTPFTILYGTDEFRLDRRAGRIHLPDVGWVDCPDIVSHKDPVGWVGIHHVCGTLEAVLGNGSPFSLDTPTIPYAYSAQAISQAYAQAGAVLKASGPLSSR